MKNYNPACQHYAAATECRTSTGCRADNPHSDCSCSKSRFPVNTAYAMAYIPFQQSGETYPCERALSRGTVFPCLDLPFIKGCCK